MRNTVLGGSIVLMFVVYTGCLSMGTYCYDIVLKNIGHSEISDAHVFYDGFRSIGGVLPPGVWKEHSKPEYPIPKRATVEWRTPDGVFHKKVVELKNVVPRDFKGEIQFEISDENSVTVRVIPETSR